MTAKKAIEILDRHYNLHFDVPRIELDEAARLGIEALKLVKKCRHSPNSWFVKELPGETIE
ncbi:hypothetical protein ES703_105356 [subsurface metagenome]